jgi:hypothetical protein
MRRWTPLSLSAAVMSRTAPCQPRQASVASVSGAGSSPLPSSMA